MLNAIRRAWQRFLSWVLPFPDVKVTLNPSPHNIKTKVRYYYEDLDFGIDIIRIHAVELNLYIPEDLIPDDEVLNIGIPGIGSYDVDLFDFVLYGLKWESTVQAVVRCIGFPEAKDFDNWVMWGDYPALTGESFPFFDVTVITGHEHWGQL